MDTMSGSSHSAIHRRSKRAMRRGTGDLPMQKSRRNSKLGRKRRKKNNGKNVRRGDNPLKGLGSTRGQERGKAIYIFCLGKTPFPLESRSRQFCEKCKGSHCTLKKQKREREILPETGEGQSIYFSRFWVKSGRDLLAIETVLFIEKNNL